MNDFDDSLFNIRSALDAKKEKKNNINRPCCKRGCTKEGLYKAPKNPGNLREYYYFCLEHIREYNKSWDYFEGCSEDFLKDYMLKDITGHRPTWPMGNVPGTRKDKPKKAADYFRSAFFDPFDLGETIFGDAEAERGHSAQKPQEKHDQSLFDACMTLETEYPPKIDSAKLAYKKQIKKNHPDVNRQDPDAEKKIRIIVDAFKVIEQFCLDKV